MKPFYRRKLADCPDSPDEKHCWHPVEPNRSPLYPYWLAMCCWCGANRFQEKDAEAGRESHGPHAE